MDDINIPIGPNNNSVNELNNKDTDTFLQSEPGNLCTHTRFATIYEPSEKIYPKGKIYTDLTGQFIIKSSTSNNYLFVLYNYHSNAILCELIKNRTKHSILAAFQLLHTKLVKAGVRPKLQRLNDQCSDILKEFLIIERINYRHVPPHVDCRNAAKRAI